MILVKLIGWIIVVLGIIAWNYYIIEKQHKSPKHGLHTFYRLVIGIVYAFLVRELTIAFLLLEFFTFFPVFNPLLNKVRGKEYWHTGLEDKEPDAITDQILVGIYKYVHPFFVWLIWWIPVILILLHEK